jgi:AcrR family transcriptional regulator
MALNVLHRRVSIVLTTIDFIDKFGIQGVSTREVAKHLGISESTIFKHFRTKNELLLAVLDHYEQYDPDIIASTKAKKETSFKDSIVFFINSYSEYYENYPAITAITQAYDILACDSQLGEKIKVIFSNRFNLIMELLDEGKSQGKLKQDTDIEKLTYIIIGSFRTICLKWRLNQYNFSLKEYSLSTINMILDEFIID